MGATILVTGGAGYIGSTLVPALLEAGHQVTVLDNFMYGQASLNHVCHLPNFTAVRGDARDEKAVRPLLQAADVVIPLAALVGAPICDRDPVGARSINRDSMLMMLRHLAASQLVIMPTTNSAYGDGDANHQCSEESPLRPVSQYAKEKVEVEQALMQHGNAVSLRLATAFGMSPRMRIDLLVNDFTWRAVTDRFVVLYEGSFKRNYIHVRDVARVFLHAVGRAASMAGQIYNVGLPDANLSKRELCERIRAQVPDFTVLEAPLGRDPDRRNYIVSNAKIAATGFAPEFSLDAGILELIKGYAMLRNARYGNV